jgi:uncharacterized membrane protein
MSQPPEFEMQDPALNLPEAQPEAGEYEFTMAQNDIIRALAVKMKFVGFIYVFIGSLGALISLIALFIKPLFGLFYLLLLTPQLLIGIWNISAANSFGQIVYTRGHDIAHLMSAIVSLRKLYTLMFWLLVLILSLVLIGIAAGLFLWTTGGLPISTGVST